MKVGDALMKAPWNLCGRRFRYRMSIILSNSNQPIILTAGKLYNLDFSQFMNVGYFYYNIIGM